MTGTDSQTAAVEDKASIGLLTPQRIHYFLLGHARAVTFDHRKHAVDHEVCREPAGIEPPTSRV